MMQLYTHQLDEQLAREAECDPYNVTWIFKAVKDHCKNGKYWEVLMHWEDESETWEPLNVIWRSDPVTLAKYADEKNLLDVSGWKRFWRYVMNKKKLNRMVKQVQLYTLRTATRIKFGIKIPRDHAEAMALDKAYGNSLWADAENSELDQLYEYKTFRTCGRNGSMRKGYTRIRVRMIYDAKQCGKRKARLVAGGHLTGPK